MANRFTTNGKRTKQLVELAIADQFRDAHPRLGPVVAAAYKLAFDLHRRPVGPSLLTAGLILAVNGRDIPELLLRRSYPNVRDGILRRQRFERQQQLGCHDVVVERFPRRRECLRQASTGRIRMQQSEPIWRSPL